MKTCTKCNRELPLIQFTKNSRRKDLLDSICKDCHKSKIKNWRQNNPEQNKKRVREGQLKRLEKGLCKHCTNKRLETSNSFCEKHWYIEAARGALGSRSLELGEKLKILMIQQNYTCPYTGDKLIPGVNAHIDHIYPRHRFPELINEINNVEWVSEKANLAKNGMTKQEFLDFCQLVSSRIAKIANSLDT